MKALRLLVVAILLGLAGAILFHSPSHGQAPAPLPPMPLGQTHCLPVFDCPMGYAGLDFRRTNTGWHVWWYYRHPVDDSLRFVRFSCPHGTCLDATAFGDRIRGLKLASDAKAAARADAGTVGSLNCATTQSVLCTEIEAIRVETRDAAVALLPSVAASAPPPPPPPPPPDPGWVAVGGTIYKHAGGKLTGVVSGKVAAKDAPCTGVMVSKAGTFVYQELTGGVAGEATRCVKP